MPFSEAINNSILNHFCNDGTWTAPTAIWCGLSSTTPTATGTNVTEPNVAHGYARVEITASEWTAANASSKTHTGVQNFGTAASTAWCSSSPMTHLVLYDSDTGGTNVFLGFKALTDNSKVIAINDSASLAAGALVISIGGT